MTVSSSTSKASYSGNGSLTTFAYNFKIFDQDDLTVILRAADGTETTQTITTHYTVTGVGSASGGNVVFGTAPASGVTVVILREQPLTQGLDLVPNDPFPAQSLEEALDKVVFMTHKHEEELGRTIKASKTNTLTGSEFTISATDRANKIFSFDSAGDLSITQELGQWRGNWAVGVAYKQRDIIRDDNNGDIYIVNTAHTSTGSHNFLFNNVNASYYDIIFDVSDFTTYNLTVTGSSSGGLTVLEGIPAKFYGDVTLGNDTNDSLIPNGRFDGDVNPRGGGHNLGQDITNGRWDRVIAENATFNQDVLIRENLTVHNDIVLGEASDSDSNNETLQINANVSSHVIPNGTNTYDLGSSSINWRDVYSEEVHTTRVYSTQLRSTGTQYIRAEATGDEALKFETTQGSVKFAIGAVDHKVQIVEPVTGGEVHKFTMYEPATTSGVDDWRITIGAQDVHAVDWTVQSGNSGVNTVLHGNLDIDGVMNIDGTTDSIGPGSGALIVDGGASIAKALHVNSTGEFAGNVIVGGNLTVNGTTTTVNSTNVTTNDTLIELAKGTTGTPSNDTGLVIERGDQDNAFIGFDESENKFKVGTGTFTGASTGNLTITTGTLVANVEGNVTGNVTGNIDGIVGGTTPAAGSFTSLSATSGITGNVTGNVTGDVKATDGTVVLDSGTDGTDASITATVTGNVTGDVSGNLTGTTTTSKNIEPTSGTWNIGASNNKYGNIHATLVNGHLRDTVYVATVGSNITPSPSAGGIHKYTLSNNISIYLTGLSDGDTITLMIDDGAGYTVQFPNSPEWVNNAGTAPTLKTSGWNVITVWKANNLYYGAVVGAA